MPTKRVYSGAPPRPDGVYDLLVDGRPAGRGSVAGGDTLTIDMATGRAEHRGRARRHRALRRPVRPR